jgi:hypothetical protein
MPTDLHVIEADDRKRPGNPDAEGVGNVEQVDRGEIVHGEDAGGRLIASQDRSPIRRGPAHGHVAVRRVPGDDDRLEVSIAGRAQEALETSGVRAVVLLGPNEGKPAVPELGARAR